MQKKSYKLSDLFDGTDVDTDGSYVCPLKDYVHVFKREIKDLQGLISIIEEHGDDVYVSAHAIRDVANSLCDNSHWSPAQRFKNMITSAIDEWCFVKDVIGKTPKRIKLTETGAEIIEHQKTTTEDLDECVMALAKRQIGKLAQLHEEN